jgi:hypothetical protein
VLKPVKDNSPIDLALPEQAMPSATQWTVQQIIPHSQAMAAVAVAQTPCQFRYWQYGKP